MIAITVATMANSSCQPMPTGAVWMAPRTRVITPAAMVNLTMLTSAAVNRSHIRCSTAYFTTPTTTPIGATTTIAIMINRATSVRRDASTTKNPMINTQTPPRMVPAVRVSVFPVKDS